MPKIRRVEFKFDERSLESLEMIKAKCDLQCIHEVTIRNPATGEERIMLIPVPRLKANSPKAESRH